MVSIEKLTREELTSIIAEELKIDVAFPCFSVEERTGATACCVVHKHWLATLKKAQPGKVISLKRYSTARSSINTEHKDPQTPTTNVLVSVLLKRFSQNKRPQLYEKFAQDETNSKFYNNFDESELPLRTFIKEQLEKKAVPILAELEANYDSYAPVFVNKPIPGLDESAVLEIELSRQKSFVQKFLESLYPQSAYFRISLSDNNTDMLSVELLSPIDSSSDKINSNPNLIDVFTVLESDQAYYFMAPYRGTTLQDLLKYSSGVLNSNAKKSFITYQLLRGVKSLHEKGVVHGELKPSNIFVDENLWISLTGFQCFVPSNSIKDTAEQFNKETILDNMLKEVSYETVTMKWVRGEISNFSYIMALNHLAGRRIGDPNFHPILPWITDFTGPTLEQNWRDFTKTKYRLNKGDEQLDFTFDGPVPHHITDILSDITYYVYLARRTPIPVLCQYVRTKYEPNEYPSSLQRLFEWTPDECIPEFYTDPTIFTSIHPDMPDLQLPCWASTPEEFIRLHSEALESDYVSSQLHHWIDLTFGCKLSGEDAVEAKNVALPLLEGQDSFMKHGITQLFADPHPQRAISWNQARREFLMRQVETKTPIEKYNILNSQIRISSRQISGEKSGSQLDKMPDFQIFNITAAEKAIAKPTNSLPRSKSNKQSPAPRPLSLYDFGNSNFGRERDAPPVTVTDPRGPLARIESLASLMNSIPIELPDKITDEIFTEELINFEHAHLFAAKYRSMNTINHESDQNVSTTYQKEQSQTDSENSFAYARAWDIYCLGKIIENIYTSSKSLSLSGLVAPEYLDMDASNGFTRNQGSCPQVPLAVKGVADALLCPDWTKRPSVDTILYSSVPVTSLYDHRTTLPIPECIPRVYDLLTRFYAIHWKERLKLVEQSLDEICNLNDEAFNMILPSIVLLFTHDTIKIKALNIFPKLGQRLGQEETKSHLLKPIVSLFESSRPSIPKILFESTSIGHFLRCFGITNFLQQLFPLYLEALTIDERILATLNPGTQDTLKYSPDADLMSNPISQTGHFDFSMVTSTPSVAQLANSALLDICSLIGPILTSKYIMKQIYKLLLKDYDALHLLLDSIAAIGHQFGETFTHLQYTHVTSVIQTHSTLINSKNTIITHLALLEKLTPHLSIAKILTEFDSGFADALNKLLDWTETRSLVLSSHNLQEKLSICSKTIDYLLHISNYLNKEDWERYIGPIIQKYFASFGMSPENQNQSLELNGLSKIEEQRDQQMTHAYSQFCNLVGQDAMRQVVPISEAIEKMHDQLMSTVLPRHASSLSVDRSPESSQATSLFAREPLSKDNLNGEEKKSLSNKSLTLSAKALSLFGGESGGKSYSSANGKRLSRSMSTGSSPVSLYSPDKPKYKALNLTWRTKATVKEDLRNWNRFLSTNSEEMSNSMQFTFNDLKLRTCIGHTSAVRGIAINENSRIIASGSRDRTVKIWSLDIHNGIENFTNEPNSEASMTYIGHRKTVGDVYFVGGGGSLGLGDVVASCDGSIHLWNPETGETLHQSNNTRNAFISIRPIFRTRYLVGGLSDTTLTFLDTNTHALLHTWKCSTMPGGTIRSVCVNPSETLIAIGFSIGIISLVDSRTGMTVGSWKAGETDIIHLRFYSNNSLVSCAPADHVILIWDTNTLTLTKTIRVNSDIVALNMYKDELITINNNNTIFFTPLNENFQAYSSKFGTSIIKSAITSLGILPINQLLILGCMEGDLFLYA